MRKEKELAWWVSERTVVVFQREKQSQSLLNTAVWVKEKKKQRKRNQVNVEVSKIISGNHGGSSEPGITHGPLPHGNEQSSEFWGKETNVK